jgi:hypothetical protein
MNVVRRFFVIASTNEDNTAMASQNPIQGTRVLRHRASLSYNSFFCDAATQLGPTPAHFLGF